MCKKRKSRGKAARGGLSYFTMRRFNAVPVSDGMCQLSVVCLGTLVTALQHVMPLPTPKLGIAMLVVAAYGLAVFYVKARWKWKEAISSSHSP